MLELSTTAIYIIALAKAILVFYCLGTIFLIWRKSEPMWHMLITTISIVAFYLVLSRPIATMWWGNTGDENLILAFLAQILHGNYFRDFYHAWLPAFYPPLYFWVTGSFARLVTMDAVQAAKIGVLLILASWFIAPTVIKRLYSRTAPKEKDGDPIQFPWFWFLAPFMFLLMIDFDTIMTKPYEVLPALLVALLTGICGQRIVDDRWNIYDFAFFGITGGILFMTFYLWMFLALAALMAFAIFSPQRKRAMIRVVMLGTVIGLIASPYLAPLLLSYVRYGVENWQGHHFVPGDFATILPWDLSLRGLIALGGLVTLVFESRRSAFLKSMLSLLAVCYVYQLTGVTQFIIGSAPLMPSKPFPFLTNACLAIAAAYGACVVAKRYQSRVSPLAYRSAITIVFLLLVAELPFVRFIDSPRVLAQLQKNLERTPDRSLSQAIVSSVPDYAERTWLVSDVPAVSAILPLSYFISFNQHYSHHAARFSEHFDLINRLSGAETPDQFNAIIDEGSPRKIDALTLYSAPGSSDYLLFFWVDNYPNGGKELVIPIPRFLLENPEWSEKYSSNEWTIIIRE